MLGCKTTLYNRAFSYQENNFAFIMVGTAGYKLKSIGSMETKESKP
jgi:hypothetical protein